MNNAQWTLSGTGFQGTTGTTWGFRTGWSLGSPGTVQPDRSIDNIQAGQFIAPGQSVNATNPVTEIWRGKWTPSPIQPGTTTRFTAYPHESYVYIRTGTDPGGNPIYITTRAKDSPATIQILHDTGPPGQCFPGFWNPPQNVTALPGEAAVFTVQAPSQPAGCPTWQYQWRRNCTFLQNGGNITGANAAALRIDPVTPADADFYIFTVNNWQGSTPARLTVLCYANCDKSTGFPSLTANDFQCFINRFANSDNYANCDSSTGAPRLTANDFQCFINKFAAGCS